MKAHDSSGARKVSGAVLAASPKLVDPNFHKTLVFIAEHNTEGAFGLVLNRPLGKALGEIAQGPDMTDPLSNVPVYYGGPVRPNQILVAVFRKGVEHEVSCLLNQPPEQAEAWLKEKDVWVRAFAGYSGWGEGQLEGELAQSAWTICKPDPVLFDDRFASGIWSVYTSPDTRWRKILPHLPEDPSSN